MNEVKIALAFDSFKNCLPAPEICRIVRQAMLEADESLDIISFPLGDGGEGTARAIASACGGRIEKFTVKDPLFRDTQAEFALLPDGSAVFEMAAASGIELITQQERNPFITTTYGTGELLRHLVCDLGIKDIIIGIGGSATVDGGIGMLQALGTVFYDENNCPLPVPAAGYDIARIKKINCSELFSKFVGVKIKIASDVTNVLCGKQGAAAVFAPQKGADEKMVRLLENNLANFAAVAVREKLADNCTTCGDGAAGGLGFALRNFLDARSVSGAELVLEHVKFDDAIKDADVIITGEGCSDEQTAHGKLPAIVAAHAKKNNVPVILLSGALKSSSDDLQNIFDAVLSIVNAPVPLEQAIKDAPQNLKRMAKAIVNILNMPKRPVPDKNR